MGKIFILYGVVFPYILFLNILSFGSNSLGIGTVLFVGCMLPLLFSTILFVDQIKVKAFVFFGLSSFLIINIFKLFAHNSGPLDFSFLVGYMGNWIFFILNFLFSALYLKKSKRKMDFLKMSAYGFMVSSIIGILHYYFFFSIPFMDPSYGTDDLGTIFNVADYDLMRFRESSIFFGPNVNAYMTVVGYLFLVFSVIQKGIVDMFRSPIYWLGLILHSWNIIISDSRSGILLITIITIIILYDKRLGVDFKISSWIKILILSALILGLMVYVKNQPRLSPEALLQDERMIKIAVGITILLSNSMNLLVGAPINDKWTIGDVSVSDNMYVALLLYVGVVGMAILVYTTIRIFRMLNRSLSLGQDYHYNLLAKYFIILFLLIGCFSIPIAMMPFMIYFGIILGGVRFENVLAKKLV